MNPRVRDWRGIAFQAIFLLPALFFLALFMYYPIEETFRLSLTRTTGLGDEVYIGLQNYIRLRATPSSGRASSTSSPGLSGAW